MKKDNNLKICVSNNIDIDMLKENLKIGQFEFVDEPINAHIVISNGLLNNEKYDELLPDCLKFFMDSNKVSVASLQKKFKIGYTRASRIIQQMINNHFICYKPNPYEICISNEEYDLIFNKSNK